MDIRNTKTIESESTGRDLQSSLWSSSTWLFASVAGHVVVLLILIFINQPGLFKLGELNVPPRKNTVSAAKLAKLNDRIRDHQKSLLTKKIESLRKTAQAMETLERQKNLELRQAFPEQVDKIINDSDRIREAALVAQRRAKERLEKGNQVSEIQPNAQSGETNNEAVLAAAKEQVEAEERLSELAAAFALREKTNNGFSEIIRKQVAASQALAAVFAHDRNSMETSQKLHHQKRLQESRSRALGSLERRRESHKSALVKFRNNYDMALKAIEESKVESDQEMAAVAAAEARKELASKDFEQAMATAQQARMQLQYLRNQKAEKADLQKARQALTQAEQTHKQKLADRQKAANEFNRQKHSANLAKHQVRVAEHEAKASQRQIEASLRQLKNAQANIDKFLTDHPVVPKEEMFEDTSAEEVTVQRQALIGQALRLQGEALRAHEAFHLQAPVDAPDSDATSDLREIFDDAKSLEREIAERFKNFRSAELALVQKMPLGEARSLVSVVSPERQTPQLELNCSVKTSDGLKEIMRSLDQANRDVAAMDEFTKSLLAQANSLRNQGLTIDLAKRQRSEQEIFSRSSQAVSGDIVDLTQLMAEGELGGESGENATSTSRQSNSDQGHTLADAKAIKATAAPQIMQQAVPARRFGSKSAVAKSGWSYIDSWYILGPFDNAERKNIHHHFPPESIVDLDARYKSKATGDSIEWKFYQSGGPKVEPRVWQGEYVIYYAFSEVYFAEATDVWIAVGSDDRSDIWINDIRVWSSSDNLKEWKINEGMRRVRFKAGMNRVLYRIENGNGPWAFSFCLSLSNQKSPR